MLLHIVHETHYRYSPSVKTAQHMAHLKPLDNARQRLLSHELSISPAPSQRSEAVDVYGNTRAFFSLPSRHEELTIVANSLVETHASAATVSAMAWEEARERMRYHHASAYEPAAEFTFASPHVPRRPEFLDYARPSFAAGRPLLASARDLMRRIHEDFEYETEATDVGTPALEALKLRKGVCQDFAHIMLACLRSLGLAARYVSGYMLTQPAPGQGRLVGSDASHAWVSLYLPGEAVPQGVWADLDPTNARAPGEEYVTLATGRDFADVSPVRGVLHGGANHALQVAVTVTPVERLGSATASTIT